MRRLRVVRAGELERAIETVKAVRSGVAGILLVLDADDDDPAELLPALRSRGRGMAGIPFGVVLARREFEAWLLGSKESLRGSRGVRSDATAPAAPEEIRGAKERLGRNMEGRSYVPSDDQAPLNAKIDLALASERYASFRVLVETVRGLAAEINTRRQSRT